MSNYHRSTHRDNELHPHTEKYARVINESSPQFSETGIHLSRNRIEKPTDKLASNLVESKRYKGYARQSINRQPETNLIGNKKEAGPTNRVKRIDVSGTIKRVTGKDTNTYDNRRSKRK
jgi:hypothetical protein